MAPTATSTSTANSGIRKLSNGDSIIPSSTRADGTVRKEIRVKPGYKPPEDVEVYKNRTAEAWKNRGKGGVPGAQVLGNDEKTSAAANKNAKRREARKKAAAAATEDGGPGEDEDEGMGAGGVVGNGGEAHGTTTGQDSKDVDPEAEKVKEARKLAKKLRQARELKEKEEKGGDLLPEQFAKVVKINELIRQLDGLGFDADGEKKQQQQQQQGEDGDEAAG